MDRIKCHIAIVFLLLLGAGRSYAQDESLLNRLYEKFADSCVELDFRELTDEIIDVLESRRADTSIQFSEDGEVYFNDGLLLDKDPYGPITNIHEELQGSRSKS